MDEIMRIATIYHFVSFIIIVGMNNKSNLLLHASVLIIVWEKVGPRTWCVSVGFEGNGACMV